MSGESGENYESAESAESFDGNGLEAFDASTHARHYAAPPERTCEAARRALLSQGYVVTAATAQEVTARKYFQPDAQHHVQMEFRVVCAPEGQGRPAEATPPLNRHWRVVDARAPTSSGPSLRPGRRFS